jgi:hypothetical protein
VIILVATVRMCSRVEDEGHGEPAFIYGQGLPRIPRWWLSSRPRSPRNHNGIRASRGVWWCRHSWATEGGGWLGRPAGQTAQAGRTIHGARFPGGLRARTGSDPAGRASCGDGAAKGMTLTGWAHTQDTQARGAEDSVGAHRL